MSNVKTKKSTNKRFRIFLFIILLTLGLVVAQAIATLTGANIKAISGASDVSYPVYLDNNESVVGFQININYSTEYLILKNVETTDRLSNVTIIFNDETPILKIAVLVNNETNKILPGNGAVLNLIFDVNESAIPANYTINFSEIIIADIDTTVFQTEIIDGIFEIIELYNLTFLPPIANEENFTLQDGATLPLKFSLVNDDGFVVDNSVLVRIFNLTLGVDYTFNASGEGDDYIRINETEEKYITNIHTGQLNMSEGLYHIEVKFDNYQIEEIDFELVDKSQGIGKGRKK